MYLIVSVLYIYIFADAFSIYVSIYRYIFNHMRVKRIQHMYQRKSGTCSPHTVLKVGKIQRLLSEPLRQVTTLRVFSLMKPTPVFTSKTSPCVLAKRPHLFFSKNGKDDPFSTTSKN